MNLLLQSPEPELDETRASRLRAGLSEETPVTRIAYLGRLTARAGKRKDLLMALNGLVDATQDEAGTLVYAVHASLDDENDVWIYELYENAEAEEAHHTSETLRAVGPTLEALIDGRVEITRLEPTGVKGVPV